MASPELVIATWILIILYVLVTLGIVVRGALKTKTVADYALGNVGFSPVAVGLALAASMTSAATFIINPGFVAYYGLSGVWSMAIFLPLGALISLYVITKGFRKQGQTVKALTMAQWIGKRYNSPNFALFFAFLSLLLITFIVLICVGLTAILSQALNLEPFYVLVGLVIFVFGYMMFGGANSMVYTNFLQAILMLVVAVVLLGSGYEHFSGGVKGFLAQLHQIDPNLTSFTNPQSPLFRDYFEIIFCQLVVGVAIVCQPHIITKSLLLKNERDINTYLFYGMIVQMIFFLVIFVGLYARLEFNDLTLQGQALKVDTITSSYVVSEFPVYISLIVVLGLISAGLSTLEGLVQSLSSTITIDICKPLFGRMLFESTGNKPLISEVSFNRIVIIILGFISVLISYQQIINPNLSVGILAQNGVYAYFSAAFVPVLFGTFLKDTPLFSVFPASVLAIVIHFGIYYGQLTPYTQGPIANPGVASALAILSSVMVGGIFYFAFRQEKMKQTV